MIVVLALVLVACTLTVVGVRRRSRARPDSRHDDQLRVGDDNPVGPHEAARRAQGRSAWTRMDGGGL